MPEAASRLTMPGYLPRVADLQIEAVLRRRGAVLIEGARGCGKTWTGRNHARSEARFDVEAMRLLAAADPASALAGEVPRLLDEWQNASGIWNPVRRECDDRAQPGQFILTGSASPTDDLTRHTGTGRVGRVLMRTMSLYESGASGGAISLRGLFEGEERSSLPTPGAALSDVVRHLVVGGWPGGLSLDHESARLSVGDYIDEITRVDIPQASEVQHNPAAVRRLLRSLARNVATEARETKLAADMDGATPGRSTVGAYLDALRRIFVVEDQPAWSVTLRSRASLRKQAKRHFVDPSLAASLLRASPERLLSHPRTLGLLFESLVVRDLRVYSAPLGGEVFHYRDDTGLEIDAVVERHDGAWIGAEVKLSPAAGAVDRAAVSLLRLRDKIAARRAQDMAGLMVVTSVGAAYRRPDGVQVVPITHLGP
ncbi:ATP-binding protein [Candidatus Poriferisodalis sp.]|uniref:ATP-binding protein n=1 Tax=Candidatus Poriferisodalis sp. TaxID=3101277 RepID=UPI003B5A481A